MDVININTSDVPTWYLEKHPLGQVPCIQQEDFVAIDSANIVDYLEEKFHQTRLRPETPEDRAKDNSFLRLFEQRVNYISCYYCTTLLYRDQVF